MFNKNRKLILTIIILTIVSVLDTVKGYMFFNDGFSLSVMLIELFNMFLSILLIYKLFFCDIENCFTSDKKNFITKK